MRLFERFAGLSKNERRLWLFSVTVVTLSFLLSRSFYPLTLIASLVGVTALIFLAKGDVLGQIMTIAFSLLYAVISLRFHYYGEMITYLGMSAPAAGAAVVSWIKNPYEEARHEVKISRLSAVRAVYMVLLAAITTVLFYFILRYFETENLVISTASVTTSFLASYLMLFRSSFYALAYAANDIVLIILWILATIENISYLPMIVCFSMFLCNDLYAFYNWNRMHRQQEANPYTGESNTESV